MIAPVRSKLLDKLYFSLKISQIYLSLVIHSARLR